MYRAQVKLHKQQVTAPRTTITSNSAIGIVIALTAVLGHLQTTYDVIPSHNAVSQHLTNQHAPSAHNLN
jgi:hypothetical protein